jgi:hypothetical protein
MISRIFINESFSNFLQKFENVISILFDSLQSFKSDIPNVYEYSVKFPPKHSNYKYTDKLFLGCILYVALNNCSWTSFIGPINGKQVHKRFMDYSKHDFFKYTFNSIIQKYLNNGNFKHILTDTSCINNKQCIEIKISAITDHKGAPLYVNTYNSNIHDVKCIENDINDRTLNEQILKHKRTIMIADKGYDSKNIKPNNRNTKNKLRKLNQEEELMYKKRIKIEHYFGKIKKYPKINNIFEKTMGSYLNLLFLVSTMVITKMFKC